MELPAIPAETRTRLIDAADRLYEESGRSKFPTVAAVRLAAQADMNTTTVVMREWKRLQTAQTAPVAVTVPDLVQQASNEAAAVVWSAAQDLANASLRSAQASWEVERTELDGMRQELAQLYEAQADELEELRAQLGAALRAQDQAAQDATAQVAVIEGLRIELAEAKASTAQAEARAVEIELRADDLKQELDRAHAETDQVRIEKDQVHAELATARTSHHDEMTQLKGVTAEQIERARIELATVKGKAEASEQLHQEQRQTAAQEALRQAERYTALQAERDTAQNSAAEARENAARLGGQLEALQTQNAAFLARIGATKSKE